MRIYQNGTLRSAAYAALAGILMAFAPPTVRAQVDSGNRPFIGVWKLNLEKSHMRNPPANFALYRQYEDHGNGWMFDTVINVSPRGAGFLFSAARYDGKQYPVYNAELLGGSVSDGTKTPRTVEFDRISPFQFRWRDRTNGKETLSGLCTVSPDGNTLTITAQAPGQKAIFAQVFDRISSAAILGAPGQ